MEQQATPTATENTQPAENPIERLNNARRELEAAKQAVTDSLKHGPVLVEGTFVETNGRCTVAVRVRNSDDRPYDVVHANIACVHRAADFIPRAEHERLLNEATNPTDQAQPVGWANDFTKGDGIGDVLYKDEQKARYPDGLGVITFPVYRRPMPAEKITAAAAVDYLVNEYRMDLPDGERVYGREYEGQKFEVTIRRKHEIKITSEPADAIDPNLECAVAASRPGWFKQIAYVIERHSDIVDGMMLYAGCLHYTLDDAEKSLAICFNGDTKHYRITPVFVVNDGSCAPARAVAPVGVVEEIKNLIYSYSNFDYASDSVKAEFNAALSRVTELPEPSTACHTKAFSDAHYSEYSLHMASAYYNRYLALLAAANPAKEGE